MAMLVAFQGERGAHSEDAAVRFFGEVDVLPCRSLREVFAAVSSGEADAALVPAENSQAGSVAETWDLLLEHQLHIVGEVDQPVEHCLQALPGQSLEDVRVVYSHPQALAQCQEFLRGLGAEVVAVYDTAGSAKMVRERRLRGAAAIASRRAAALYGLEVLAAGIQDHRDNRTRFFAVAREPAGRGERNRTVLVMGPRASDRPGALFWCLAPLAFHQINMVKLESRPSRQRPWDYIFYLMVDGHVSDPGCAAALAELRLRTAFLRVLGSYPLAATPPGATSADGAAAGVRAGSGAASMERVADAEARSRISI